MVFDLYIPSSSFDSDAWLAFFNSHTSNANDSEAFVRLQDGGVGISGQYHGAVRRDVWHRLALVFKVEGGEVRLRKYLDGAEVGSQNLGPPDGRWSLNSELDQAPWFLLFTDDDGESSSAYLNSFLFAGKAMAAAEIVGLGGVDAGGILDGPCLAASCPGTFRRGDANGDGGLDIADAVSSLLYQFAGREAPACLKSLDADDSGAVEIGDAVAVLLFLFLGGPSPKPPFPACG